jgi:hypothetical protein
VDDKTKMIGAGIALVIIIYLAMRQRSSAGATVINPPDTSASDALASQERLTQLATKADVLKSLLASDSEKAALTAQSNLAQAQLASDNTLATLQVQSGERVSLASFAQAQAAAEAKAASEERAAAAANSANLTAAGYAREIALAENETAQLQTSSQERVATTLANSQAQITLSNTQAQSEAAAAAAATAAARTAAEEQAAIEQARIQAQAQQSVSRSQVLGTIVSSGLGLLDSYLNRNRPIVSGGGGGLVIRL